jgi:hypothetical protein
MKELYALAYFDNDGNFIEYVRKGRNNSISGYDSLTSAKRGMAHSKSSYRARMYQLRIVKASEVEIIKEDD